LKLAKVFIQNQPICFVSILQHEPKNGVVEVLGQHKV
jgi:hypothetical protein